ncbi:MAG: OmpA family protein [Saprospiraceae bacterium]|nr:OmpA family protein [Saprospiraceae bacterium]
MRKIFFLLLFSAVSLSIGWTQPANSNTPVKLNKAGEEQIAIGQYYNALDLFEKSYKELKDKNVAIQIAKTHFLLRDYNKSATWYSRILNRDKKNEFFENRVAYGRALKMNGQSTEAASEFNSYIATGVDESLKDQARMELAGIAMMETMKDNPSIIIKNIGNNVNNSESQSSPVLEGNELYYGSLTDKSLKKDSKDDGVHYAKLFSSSYSEGKGYEKGVELPEEINREGYHTTNSSISMDGTIMFFTRTLSEGGLSSESKIYACSKTASGWSPAIEVNGVNGDYLATHPIEGELYGSKVLFFTSNMQGGKGGMDLYYATKIGEIDYSAPVNLSSINTAGDEITPYYLDGILYFSSDGRPGLGGLDIYSTRWNGSEWSEPMNMGIPFNTCTDEFSYKIGKDGDRGFLVSNRPDPESKSLKSKTCCDDIYLVNKRKLVIELIAIVKDTMGKSLKGASVQLITMNADGESDVQTKTNNEGNRISSVLDKDKAYKVVVTKDGYFPQEISLNTVGIDKDQTIEKEFILRALPAESEFEIISINEPIRLNNIYYKLDDDKILPDAVKDLQILIDLMTKYPDMVIELRSHTDSRADDAYNQKLSERRASSARRWMMNKGIDGKRIKSKGLGETQILNGCTNGEDCTEEEHKLNRRTEFVIVAGPTTIEVKKEVLNKKAGTNKK